MRDELTAIVTDMKNMASVSGDSERILVTMRDQLDDLYKNVEKFSKVLDTYKTNLSAIGIWIGDVTAQPLQIDRILAKSKRKRMETLDLNELTILAPLRSHEVDYYRKQNVKRGDYSSGEEANEQKKYMLMI